jgi:ADP-ribosyl-[dinitrogen reductase] hydrolase
MRNRFRGCLLGLACGDAVGTTNEFARRGTFRSIADMVGGGPFGLRPGQWTDDTSMALCLAASLIECEGFNPRDQMDRYLRWLREGYFSSTGRCFDVGNTITRALALYEATRDPFSGPTEPDAAGNGSLMRLAPVPMYYVGDISKAVHYSGESSRTTHGTREAVDACRLFGAMLVLALRGESKERILREGHRSVIPASDLAPRIEYIAAGAYMEKDADGVRGSGYVVACLEAALWCFHTTDDYREAILTAANLGDDADTTAAVSGQIAGAFYGVEAIPEGWLERCAMADEIGGMADLLYEGRHRPVEQSVGEDG